VSKPEIEKFRFSGVFADVYFRLAAGGIVAFEIVAVYAMSVGLGHAGPEGEWGALAMLGVLTNFVGLAFAAIVEGDAPTPGYFWLIVGAAQTIVDLTLAFFIRANQRLKGERETRLDVK
jgi:hypothetical protein